LDVECSAAKDFNENLNYLWVSLSLYNKGSRMTGAKEHHELGMWTIEGKNLIPSPVYE
jgi:hypothetical protein